MSQRAGPGNPRKRGHQHHPRNDSNRRRAALDQPPTNPPLSPYSVANVATKQQQQQQQQQNVMQSASKSQAPCDTTEVIDLTNCDDEVEISNKSLKDERNSLIRKPKDGASLEKRQDQEDMSLVYRPAAEGSSQSDQEEVEDPEIEELSRLRCTSERAEVVAERETRRRGRRCADYPGLAFASSIFSSDTLIKFSIIRNELHNIMNTQLKRVGFCVEARPQHLIKRKKKLFTNRDAAHFHTHSVRGVTNRN
jgi:tropomyosin-1